MKQFIFVFALATLAALATTAARTAVTVGGLSYSIQDVHTASSVGPEEMEQKASGEFIVLRLRISNVGKSPATISATDFHLRRGNTNYDAAASESMMTGNSSSCKR